MRVARRRYNQMLQETTPTKLSAAIVHFLNCLFGEVDEPKEHQGTEEVLWRERVCRITYTCTHTSTQHTLVHSHMTYAPTHH